MFDPDRLNEIPGSPNQQIWQDHLLALAMLGAGWRPALQAAGELTNDHLLNDLHVHRSSFVCAALAQLPEVEVLERRPIKLALRG